MEPTFLGNVVQFDRWLFESINSRWTSPLLDFILPFLTDLNKQKWIPLAIAVTLTFWVLRQRYRALMWIIVLVISVGVTDFVCYRVIKSASGRDRPEQAGLHPVLRTTHHSGSSFPSNHAANAFAAAAVLAVALPVGAPAFYFVAFAIAYSRVYVGVHFPLDVIAGAFLGWAIAFITRLLLARWIIRAELSEEDRFEKREVVGEKSRRQDLLKRRDR